MAKSTSGTETVNRQGTQYKGSWEIRGAEITITIAGIGQKTVHVGGSADTPQGLVRQVMSRIIDDFESQQS
jgi:hypothetical protein